MGTAYNTNVVTDGLRGCWDAGNRKSYPTTGTTWYDVVGGANGTLMNEDDDALNFNSFKGGYFELDGTDGRVDCGDNLICTWSEVSICLWASATDISSGSMGMVSRGHGVVFEFSMSMDTAQKCLSCLVDGGWLLSDAGSLNSYFGKWTHYAMRWITGTDNFRLYINGEVVKTGTQNIANIGSSGKQNLCIGDRGLVNNKEFNGDIGPVYIYDRALSDDEIKQNYEATKSRFEPRITKSGLVGNWDAGDPESYNGGSTWKDTANDNNGTLSGDTFFNTAGGGSFTFNSADDYVTIANESNFDIGTACTITAWVYLDSLGDSDYGRIIDKASALSSSTLDGFHFHCNTSNSFGAAVGCSTTNARSVSATSVLSLNTWMHLVMVFNEDGSKKIKQYKDGVKLTLATDTAGVGSIDNSSVSPRIGNYAGDTSRSFDGDIAVVRFYDKALSAAEIMDNYQKTKGRFGH